MPVAHMIMTPMNGNPHEEDELSMSCETQAMAIIHARSHH